MNHHDLRAEITSKIIQALESDKLPWVRPWRVSENAGHPKNIQSHKSYRGINPLLLELHSMRHEFTSRWWGTINQWNSRGGTIKRRPADVAPGQWGARVIYFAPIKKKTVDKDTGEEATDRFLLMRGYTVFNLDQVEGADLDKFRANKEPEGNPAFADFGPAEELLKASGFEIKHQGEKAYYRRPEPFDQFPNHTEGHYIVLPPKPSFFTEADYYRTAFHEAAHASEVILGHDYRVKGYGYGELVAEISSSMVAGELHLPQGDHVTASARYVRTWIDNMKADTSWVIKAASQASAVTTHLLSYVRGEESVEEDAAALTA
jgi:antirestriction protein ArdC